MAQEGHEWGVEKFKNVEPHSLYRSPSIVRVIKSRRLRLAYHVARMEKGGSAFKILTSKPTGNTEKTKYMETGRHRSIIANELVIPVN